MLQFVLFSLLSRSSIASIHMLPKFIRLTRQDPSFWEEVKLQGKQLLKLLEVVCQIALACDLVRRRKVVDLLVRLQRLELVVADVQVLPHNVEFT